MRCSRAARAALLRWPPEPPARRSAKPRAASATPRRRARRARPRAVLAAGTAEAAVAACGRGEVLDFFPGDGDDGGDHELGDAVAATDADGGAAEVDEQYLHLAPVVGVDRPGRVEERQAVAVRETAARPDLTLVPGRDGDREPSRLKAKAPAITRLLRDVRGIQEAGGRLRLDRQQNMSICRTFYGSDGASTRERHRIEIRT